MMAAAGTAPATTAVTIATRTVATCFRKNLIDSPSLDSWRTVASAAGGVKERLPRLAKPPRAGSILSRQRGDRRLRVTKAVGIDGSGRAHERLRVHHLVPPIEPHDGDDPPLRQIEGQEASLLDRSADHDVVPPSGLTEVLQVVFVLVGPEPVDLVVGPPLAHHAPRGRGAVQPGVLPVLDAHAAEQRMRMQGVITSGGPL